MAVAFPVGLILGFFTGDLFIPPTPSPERLVQAATGVLQFDSFLTVGWTIAFTLFGRWLKEIRNLRKKLIELGKTAKIDVRETVQDLESLSSRAFRQLVAAIFLILISAFFAVRSILLEGPVSLLLSLVFLGVGSTIMIVGWLDLHSSTQAVTLLIDTAPEPPASSPT